LAWIRKRIKITLDYLLDGACIKSNSRMFVLIDDTHGSRRILSVSMHAGCNRKKELRYAHSEHETKKSTTVRNRPKIIVLTLFSTDFDPHYSFYVVNNPRKGHVARKSYL
jgi:hypothetical protein